LVKKYDGTGLSTCKTKDRKKWNATGPKAAKQLTFFKPYFSELSTLSLKNHSLCQTHYNQVVMSNRFYEHLSSYFQENLSDTDLDTQTLQYLEKQTRETEELTKRLQQVYEEVNSYQRLYEDQFERNRALIEQWDS
ncbi:42128_t:CDS:2, partial [Gigaspora margarita]